MTRFLSLILTFALAIASMAQAQVLRPADGLTTPEESLAFVQGLFERGQYTECANQAAIFLERYPEHSYTETVETCRIQSLYALQKYGDTSAAIQEHLRKFPKSANRAEFLWTLGECLRNTGDYANALPAYEDMLKNAKGDQAEDAHYRLALCLIHLNRIEEAKKHLQTLAQLPAETKHLPRLYARHYLAKLRQSDGDPQGALADCQALLAMQNLPGDLRKTLLLDTAQIAFMPPIQDYQLAENYYGSYLTEYPSAEQNTAIRKNLLACHFGLRHYKDFLELYERLCQDVPDIKNDIEMEWLVCRSLFAVNRFSEALSRLKALQSNETLTITRKQEIDQFIIRCLDALHSDEELIPAAKQYCQDYPNALDVNDTMLFAICAEERRGLNADAIADLKTLLPRLAAGNPEVYQFAGRKLSNLLTNAGDFKQAADIILELAAHAPEARTSEHIATRRELQISALIILSKLPEDPRGLSLAKQLAQSETDSTERLKFLQAQYQFACNLKKYDDALEAVAIALPIDTPRQQVAWLQQRAQIHRATRQYSPAADDYIEIINHPESTQEIKNAILPDLVALLYYTKRNDEVANYLPALFAITPQPKLSQQLLYYIASSRTAADDYPNARLAYQRLLEDTTLTDKDRDATTVQAAQVEFLAQDFVAAKRLLKANEDDRLRRGLMQSSDALAILGEISLIQGDADNAYLYAKQALDGKDKVVLPETLSRAHWITAKALLNKGDNESAFTAASMGFILNGHPTYSPRCYLVAIQAQENMGRQKEADELRKSFQNEYPNCNDL